MVSSLFLTFTLIILFYFGWFNHVNFNAPYSDVYFFSISIPNPLGVLGC